MHEQSFDSFPVSALGDRYHRQEGGDDAADVFSANTEAGTVREHISKAQSRVEELLKNHVSLVVQLSRGKMRIDCPHLSLSLTHTQSTQGLCCRVWGYPGSCA